MDAKIVLIFLLILMISCSSHEPTVVYKPKEVKVPVPVRVEPPQQLMLPILVDKPEFISPNAPDAIVALDEKQAKKLKTLLNILKSRLDAWKAWVWE